MFAWLNNQRATITAVLAAVLLVASCSITTETDLPMPELTEFTTEWEEAVEFFGTDELCKDQETFNYRPLREDEVQTDLTSECVTKSELDEDVAAAQREIEALNVFLEQYKDPFDKIDQLTTRFCEWRLAIPFDSKPSVRFDLNVSTVVRAYEDLYQQWWTPLFEEESEGLFPASFAGALQSCMPVEYNFSEDRKDAAGAFAIEYYLRHMG